MYGEKERPKKQEYIYLYTTKKTTNQLTLDEENLCLHHQTAYLSNFMFEFFFMLRGIGDSSIWAGYRYGGIFLSKI
jgi:hypothetical protein